MRVLALALVLYMLPVAASSEVCVPCERSRGAVVSLDQIGCLTGTNFDIAYMQAMYQLHSDISAMAAQAMQRLSGIVLVKLSDQIRKGQDDQNAKLAMWYRQLTGGQLTSYPTQSNPDFQRLQCALPAQYGDQYACTMLVYLGKARQGAALGMSRATLPDLKNQAKLVEQSAAREIEAIRKWQNGISVYE